MNKTVSALSTRNSLAPFSRDRFTNVSSEECLDALNEMSLHSFEDLLTLGGEQLLKIRVRSMSAMSALAWFAALRVVRPASTHLVLVGIVYC